jgi:hypothetical protein
MWIVHNENSIQSCGMQHALKYSSQILWSILSGNFLMMMWNANRVFNSASKFTNHVFPHQSIMAVKHKWRNHFSITEFLQSWSQIGNNFFFDTNPKAIQAMSEFHRSLSLISVNHRFPTHITKSFNQPRIPSVTIFHCDGYILLEFLLFI